MFPFYKSDWLSGALFRRPPKRCDVRSPEQEVEATFEEKHKVHKALVVNVVREGLLRAGVLAHQARFKMLMLDRAGQTYLVLIDVAADAAALDAFKQGQCEAWIRHTASLLHRLKIERVYWRRARPPGHSVDQLRPGYARPSDLSETHYASLD